MVDKQAPKPASRDTAVASRCLGCAPTILDVGHMCGGNQIPTAELGWWCDCPEAECRRRQAGEWPKKTKKPPRTAPAK